MSCRAVIVSSRGNPTCIVDESYFEAPYATFTELVRTLGVEQAGAVKRGVGSTLHLRMMGREFSLNGIASAAIAYRTFYGNEFRSFAVRCHLAEGRILAATALLSAVDPSGFVAVTIAFPHIHRDALVTVKDMKREFSEVWLPGIRHVLVPAGVSIPTVAEAGQILADVDDHESMAVGIVFFRLGDRLAEIWPYVWVPQSALVSAKRQAAGDGALALAMLRWYVNASEWQSLKILQPAGGVTTVERVPLRLGAKPDYQLKVQTMARTESILFKLLRCRHGRDDGQVFLQRI